MLSRKIKFSTTNIDQRSKDIVLGFIHRHENKNNECQIPTVIGCICLLYYHVHERFTTKESNHTVISSSNNIHDCQNDIALSTYHRGNIYGTITVNFEQFVSRLNTKSSLHSDNHKSDVCFEWKFEIKSNGNIGIGLHSLTNKYPFISYGWTSTGIEFLSIRGHQMYTGHEFKKDDIITMKLYLHKRTLQFFRNDKEYPSVVIRNIDNRHNYKLAILMLNNQSCIKIIDFKISTE